MLLELISAFMQKSGKVGAAGHQTAQGEHGDSANIAVLVLNQQGYKCW